MASPVAGALDCYDTYETGLVPNSLILLDLYGIFDQYPRATILRDVTLGLEVTREKFLRDILGFRNHLLEELHEKTRADLKSQDDREVFISILLPPNYDFWVGFMAVQAIGAIAAPLSVAVLPAEAHYFAKLTNAKAIITSKAYMNIARDTMCLDVIDIHEGDAASLRSFNGCISLEKVPCKPNDKGGVVFFTSGTTGKPKGVLHSQASVHASCVLRMRSMHGGLRDTMLSYSPVHWASGLVGPLSMMLIGACVEICTQGFTPAWFWKRLETGHTTMMSTMPAMLQSLANYFEEHIKSGPSDQLARAKEGLFRLRHLTAGGAMVPERIMRYWQELRKGRPLTIIYGTSEALLICSTDRQRTEPISPGCVGKVIDGLTTNLADGEEGELKLKGCTLFTRYLSTNPNIMDGVFDDEGFYKTDDLARREKDDYYILGRASADVIRDTAWKMNTNDIEEQIASIPQIMEVMVLRVIDELFNEKVGAIVKFSTSETAMTLKDLRAELLAKELLPRYKLPYALKTLGQEEKIPQSSAGKPSKAKAGQLYFSEGWTTSTDVEIWNGEVGEEQQVPKKAFDWAGMEASFSPGIVS